MKSVEEITKEVFSNPTAPYREQWVLDYVKKELTRMGISFFTDSWGNIIAGVKKPLDLKRGNQTALVAHTDHPGFHLVKKLSATRWAAKWYGGCPPNVKGARLAIYHPSQPHAKIIGVIESAKLTKKKTFVIKLKGRPGGFLNNQCFGAFDFRGFQKRGSRIFTRVADDLTGVVIILATFARLKANERKHLIGIFTRAEETGFRGALGLIYSRKLGKNIKVISLEASRALEGARIGKGPVIRLGDKKSLFDSRIISQLDSASAQLKKRDKKIKFQRRIMNGGTCEATAFNLYKTPAAGIAIPLGNYHNERANGRPGAEHIDLHDLEMGVKLCTVFYKNAALRKDPTKEFAKKLERDFKKDIKLLKQKVVFKKRDFNA